MSKVQWFPWLGKHRRSRAQEKCANRRRSKRHVQLSSEPLESRLALALFTWNTDASGNWETASNWLNNDTFLPGVPNSGDNVTLDRGTANPTITINDHRTVNSLISRESLVIATGGTLILNGASQIEASTLTLAGSAFQPQGAVSITSTGTFDWQSGGIFGNGLTNAGLLKVTGATDKAVGGFINNQGTVQHSGSGDIIDVASGGGSRFDNQAGAVYDFTGDDGIVTFSTFNNVGTVRKSAGTGESRFLGSNGNPTGMAFNNLGGSVESQAGTLRLASGTSTSGGTFNASMGAVLDLTGGGSASFSGTYTGSGLGRVEVGTGTLSTADTGVTFDFPLGLFQWTAGAIAGASNRPFVNEGVVTISGTGDRTLFGSFINNDTVIHTDTGRLLVNTSSIFDTTASGVYDFQGDGTIGRNTIGGGFGPSFRVVGTLRKSGGLGTSLIDGEANGLEVNVIGGTIDVQVGRLKIDEGGAWEDGVTLNAATDAVLEISGDRQLHVVDEFTGSGGGRVEWNITNISSRSFDDPLGTAQATFNFPEGLAYWLSGGIASGGFGSLGFPTTLMNAGYLTLEGAGGKGLGGTGLINEGTIINTGSGSFGLGGVTFDNRAGAVYEHRGDSVITGTDQFNNSGHFINAGTFKKTAGSGTVDFNVQLENKASGVIEVESGRMRFSRGGASTGGTFHVSSAAVLEFGGNDVFGWAGTYTGNGSGTVEFRSLLNGNDGNNPARLDFPAGLFQMISGQLLGSIVNVGTFDFATSTGVYTRAGITNLGTWIHSGAGDFVLNANSRFTNIGLYDLQTDADLVSPNDGSGGTVYIINTGTFQKSGGLGVSSFRHDGTSRALQIDNTGTVDVLSGTLSFDDGGRQFSGANLTDGEWIVRSFATLEIPNGSNFTTNFGSVALDGPNSSFARINSLATNRGNFTLLGGRDFTTAGNLTNSGQLTAGPASTLTVNGTLTEATFNNLVGWWRGEGDATDSADASPINGTLSGNTTFAAGQFGQAFSFDGNGDFVSLGNPTDLRLQDFTISAWVKREDSPADGGLIFGYGQSGYSLGMFADGKLFLTNVGISHVQTTNLALADTNFHHVAVTRSGNTVTFYIDGVAEVVGGYVTNFSFGTNAAIGNRADSPGPGDSFQGRIDEVAVFNRPLTAAEIQALGTNNNPTAVGNVPPTLNIQVADRPGTGQFGQINSTGIATLTGRLNIETAQGFAPPLSDVYQVMSFPSRSGNFTSITGVAGLYNVDVQANAVVLNSIAAPPIDLAVESIGFVPASGQPGENVTVNYVGRNLADASASGSWTDSIYLSRDITYSPDDVLFTRVTHTGGVANLSTYAGNGTASLPGLIDGEYHFIVIANSRGEAAESNRNNNAAASANRIEVTIPTLALDSTTSGSIANGQDVYFRLDVPAGGDVVITSEFAALNQAEFLVSYGQLPTRSEFDFAANDPSELERIITLSSPQSGPYYVLLHGREGAGAGQPFSIRPEQVVLGLNDVSPSRGSNLGQVTSTIKGAGFTPSAEVHLVSGVNSVRQGVVQFADSNTLFVTFNLVGLAPGVYGVRVEDVAGSVTTPNAFTVTTGQVGQLEFHISGPGSLRAGRAQTIYIDYENTGETDIPARVFTLFADNSVLRLPEQAQYRGHVIDLLAINRNGPADVLPPGARGTIPVVFLPSGSTSFEVQVNHLDDELDWNTLEEPLRPADVPADAWSALFENFKSQVGDTTGDYEAVLRDNAKRLSQLGVYTHDVSRLLAFEFDQANDFGAIAARYEFGVFGRGQPSVFETAAVTDSNGNVTLVRGNVFRRFARQSNGSFLATPGDEGVLTRLPSGAYRLREATGITLGFRTDGLFDFVEAPSSERVTTTYTSGRLASLSDNLGNTMQLVYNGNGKVSQVIDAVGRVTQLTYDASAQHLVQIIAPEGTTTIGYVSGQGEAREHAVSSIAFPNGTHAFYQYDSQGRLTLQTRDGNAEPNSFTYDTAGGVVSTSALGDSSEYWRNDNGDLGRFVNPLDQVFSFAFDAAHNLNRLTTPLGGQVTLAADSLGNPKDIRLPEGQRLELNFDPVFSQLQTLRDARGNTTAYEVDAHGNRVRITNADASEATFAYNSLGQLTEAVNRRGQSIRYFYDAEHLLSRKELPGGLQIDYTYDAHRNLATLSDASGTTEFDYDSADRLTKVTYPNGRFLEFTYNGLGQRVRLEDQDGFVVNYTYNALGRLATVSRGANNPVVEYLYDAAGRLARANLGNGAFTTYEYDDVGRVVGVVNHRDGVSELSHYNYVLDATGRPVSLDSPEGVRSFEYDRNLQLVGVELPSGRALEYEYDDAGNRIAVTDDGQTTPYAANSLNQYTTVGAASFTYDADGNLASRTDGLGTTTYDYDAENRLVSASAPGHTWSYEYDALGNMVAVVHNGQRAEYLVDPTGIGSIVGEYTGGGALVANNLQGLGLVGRVDGSGDANFYHFDATGNTVQITDASGNTLNDYNYLPFGEQVSAVENVANPYTFNGRFGILDPGDGLYHMRLRTYDPALGRFAQADPLNVFGGDTNLYRFALNDPISFVDPVGLQTATANTAEQDAQAGIDALNNLKGSSGEALNNAKSLVDAGSKAPGVITGGAAIVTGGLVLATYAGMALSGAASVLTAGFAGAFIVSGGGLIILGGGILAYTFSDSLGLSTPVQNVLSDQVQSNQCVFLHAQQMFQHLPPFTPAEIAAAARACRDEMFPGQVHRSGEQVSNDPNEIIGPAAFVLPDQTLPYEIHFENLATATAPAQDVVVTHQLDTDLDFSTFELGDFGFGSTFIDVPDGRNFYYTRIELPAAPEIGGAPLWVDVTAGIDLLTGVVTWEFHSLDPATGDLTSNALAGFLPPNTAAPNGEGFVNFRIRAKDDLTTGARIDATATIVFDTNAPLDTAPIFSTIDTGDPESNVNRLPVNSNTSTFVVTWGGDDDASGPTGSGIASFDVYVSDNGGQFVRFLQSTSATSAMFTGVVGHTYSFYSVATDFVGHREEAEGEAQATTTVTVEEGGSITGFVYVDVNNNGVKDAGELGLPNVPITISGPVTLTTHTAANGSYTFLDLPGGTYTITQTQPSAFNSSQASGNGTGYGEEDPNVIDHVALAAGGDLAGYNFGERGLKANLVTKRLFLASTPPSGQLLLDLLAPGGNEAFNFTADEHSTLTVDGEAEDTHLELYTKDWLPVALDHHHGHLTAELAEGEGYILLVNGESAADLNLQVSITALLEGLYTFFTNHANRHDIDHNGAVTNLDAFRMIGELRQHGAFPLQTPADTTLTLPLYLDVNGDGQFTNIDVFTLISHLRAHGPSGSSGEGEALAADEQLFVGAGSVSDGVFSSASLSRSDSATVEPEAVPAPAHVHARAISAITSELAGSEMESESDFASSPGDWNSSTASDDFDALLEELAPALVERQ